MQITDPVCGKSFDIDRSVSAAEHEGWMYFFCSNDCQRRFSLDPGRYSEPRLRARPSAAGMARGQEPVMNWLILKRTA